MFVFPVGHLVLHIGYHQHSCEVCNVLVHVKFLLRVSALGILFLKNEEVGTRAFCCALKVMVLKAILSSYLQMIRGPPEL